MNPKFERIYVLNNKIVKSLSFLRHSLNNKWKLKKQKNF